MNRSQWLQQRRILPVLLAIAVTGGVISWILWNRRAAPISELTSVSGERDQAGFPWSGGEDVSRRPMESGSADAYVGSQACSSCHAEISETFARHPMGQSLAPVAEARPIEDDTLPDFDPPGPWRYRVERAGTRVWHHEQMVSTAPRGPLDRGTEEILYDQAVEVSYALGSGTRGRSYLIERDGQFFSSPINWYSGSRRWDLAPGYPPENHLRFERLVREECLFCHAGRTSPAQPAVARYADPPFREAAIGCERCHGPGQRHVDEQRAGRHSDATAPSIVNPRQLEPELRESVCNQCHLHGEIRIPRHGRQLADFRPGQRLEDILSVLIQPAPPTEKGSLRAVSQVEQICASACFERSAGGLGCISCHDPHAVSRAAERRRDFNHKCLNCHVDKGCSLIDSERAAVPAEGSCIDCHMPRGDAGGIPHTAQTDHRIRRRPADDGAAPSLDLKALVFFDDSSARLPEWERSRARGIMLLELGSQRRDRVRIAAEAEKLLRQALAQTPDDVETLHALGTACLRQSRQREALECWDQILERQPDRLDTLQTHAVLCQAIGELDKAAQSLERLLRLSPWQAEYFGRYAELLATAGNWEKAMRAAARAVEIDPSRPQYRQLFAVALARLGRESESRRQLEILQKIAAAAPH